MATKLKRSSSDKMIFGVCGGLAEHFDMDSTLMRIIAAVGLLISGGTVVFVYLLMAIIMPRG